MWSVIRLRIVGEMTCYILKFAHFLTVIVHKL